MTGEYLFVSEGFDQTRIYSVCVDQDLNVEHELTTVENKDHEQIVDELIEKWPLFVKVERVHKSAECRTVIPVAEIVDINIAKIAEDELGEFFLSVVNYLDNCRHIRIANDEDLAVFMRLYCPV